MLLIHKLTGHIGNFIEKRNGYFGEVTIIRLLNGREYFAPSAEFKDFELPKNIYCFPETKLSTLTIQTKKPHS